MNRPWATQQAGTLAMYRASWQYVVRFFRQQQVTNVTWVWCPGQQATIAQFYPEADCIDWLGIDINNPVRGADRSLATRYQLLHNAIRLHPDYAIRQKPVLITRLEPVRTNPEKWLVSAVETVRERYPEIRGIVLPGRGQVRLARATLANPIE